jgi:hypothetical protein
MSVLPGVTTSYRTDGSIYYRASVTYHNKHISLGGFETMEAAGKAYQQASLVLATPSVMVEDYASYDALPFGKYVSLVNFRCNHLYFKTPIYLCPRYFLYYLTPDHVLKFDRDDLFFYASHTIQQKGGYLFVCHYGSQYGILSRYGIHQFAVEGRDYVFVNGDHHDFRYQNIKVINQYMGVSKEVSRGRASYTASIHVNGNFVIGHYTNEIDAAIAYNKAGDILTKKGLEKQFIKNYITSLSAADYQARYASIQISEHIYDYTVTDDSTVHN